MIRNETYNVGTNARDLFMQYIGIGDEYVMYTADRDSSYTARYECIVRKAGTNEYTMYVVERGTDGTYAFTQSACEPVEMIVEHPYYSYSNVRGGGQRTELPVSGETVAVCSLIVTSTIVLYVVFRSVFDIWQKKRR